jgi:hypothetical protein
VGHICQVLCHPDLVADLDPAVFVAVAGIDKGVGVPELADAVAREAREVSLLGILFEYAGVIIDGTFVAKLIVAKAEMVNRSGGELPFGRELLDQIRIDPDGLFQVAGELFGIDPVVKEVAGVARLAPEHHGSQEQDEQENLGFHGWSISKVKVPTGASYSLKVR